MKTFTYDVDGDEIEITVDNSELREELFYVVKDIDGTVSGLNKQEFEKALNAFCDSGLIDFDESVDCYADDLKYEFYDKAKEAQREGEAWERQCRGYFPRAPLR